LHPETNIDASFARVVEIMRRLRAPNGCPWDREQSFDSIRTHTIEEAYEVLEAIGDRNWPGLCEELGDLLLQVVFYSEMAEEAGYFDMQAVLRQLADKLVRRHPHVFGAEEERAASPEQALDRWNAAKAAERGAAPASRLAGIPKHLPALAEAGKLGHRAASVGFDWPDVPGVLAKVEEELLELRAECEGGGAAERQEEELGDLLFTLVNLARHLGLDAEAALKGANRKFAARFQAMESSAPGDLRALSPAEWDRLWSGTKS